MNDVTREVEQVIKQLKAEGKQPSVALIKSRLSHAVPLPQIVHLLARDKAGNSASDDVLPQAPALTLEERVRQLEQQVAMLQTQLNAQLLVTRAE